jgi:hypothetical protein
LDSSATTAIMPVDLYCSFSLSARACVHFWDGGGEDE